jgi:hypothetical protein
MVDNQDEVDEFKDYESLKGSVRRGPRATAWCSPVGGGLVRLAVLGTAAREPLGQLSLASSAARH